MSMSVSVTPSIGASVRRLKNSTLVAPNTVSRFFAASHSEIWPRVSSGNPVRRWQREFFLPGVFRFGKGRIGVAEFRLIAHRAVAARRLEQQRLVRRRHMPVRQRRQPLDIHRDRFQRVLGRPLRLRHHHRDRLADVAHLVLGDDRLQIALELRQVGQPQRDDRHAFADFRRRDHRMHARHGPRRRRVDLADAAMRHGAAQHHRVQHPLAR